jgi:methionyl-tRNA formyltransferase
MNIIFMGTPEFAVPSLEALLHSNHKISSVVTVPDKPQGRGLKISRSPVKEFSLEHNLKVLQPESLKDKNFIQEVSNLNSDLIVVVAFRILSKEIFNIPRYRAFNLHASLLPKYRGAAPINWAIINGEKETGVTTFFLEEKVDTGNIILQEKCSISDGDDAGMLHDKLMHLGANAVIKTVDMIESFEGNVQVLHQDNLLASPAPKILKDNCRILWHSPVNSVYNFIRGLSPHPGAFTFYNGKILKIFKVKICPNQKKDAVPGRIIIENDKIFVDCIDGSVEICEIQAEGRKRLNASEFLRGHFLQNGHVLEK